MARYKSAIIACGNIARCHARAWQDIPEVDLWCIADSNEEALAEFGDFFGVPPERRYHDYRQMLDKERPDFVDVCSWHGLHAEMTVAAAARAPKAIITQKPMAMSLAEADQMLIACQREGVKLLVAHQRRHLAGWLVAQQRVADGLIGEPVQITLESGSLLNVLSHDVNMALFLLGDRPVEWVMGAVERTTDRYERSHPCEDAALGMALVQGGVSMIMSSNLDTGRRGHGCRLIGTEGMLELGVTRPPNDQLRSDGAMRQPEGTSAKYNDETGYARYLTATSGGWQRIEAPWHDPFVHLAQEAVDWVEGRVTDPISSGQKGRNTLEVLMALYESARKRQRVDLPLKTLANPLKLMVDSGELPVEWPGRFEVRARIVRGERMSWDQ
ncbi:MAG: Gfo/Idh/MocA family oxidoreductase [Chloroflexi bacterium]|nr:Gfo/Idh/MocA family oxidoreductase [Chloroflexota bacterium]